MKISSKGRYAVRVMADIALTNEEFVSLSEIADRQKLSLKYLEQIISKLVKAKLLCSQRGKQGGYKLTRAPKDISVSQILAVTGDLPKFAPCINSSKNCPLEKNCTGLGCWATLSKIIFDYLDNVSLQDLLDKTY